MLVKKFGLYVQFNVCVCVCVCVCARARVRACALLIHNAFLKVKSALAEERIQPVMSHDIEAIARPPTSTPADTPLSQPIKLRFKLNSDVVGESSVSPDVSKETVVPPAPIGWPTGGHSSHKKKRKHKKEKKKKKKKYHDRYC